MFLKHLEAFLELSSERYAAGARGERTKYGLSSVELPEHIQFFSLKITFLAELRHWVRTFFHFCLVFLLLTEPDDGMFLS